MQLDAPPPRAAWCLMASELAEPDGLRARQHLLASLSGEDEGELRGYWDRLSVGGSVTMPLGPAPWGDTFGMCTDKFGVNWLVDIAAAGTSGGAPGS